jgi:hypothetical protein
MNAQGYASQLCSEIKSTIKEVTVVSLLALLYSLHPICKTYVVNFKEIKLHHSELQVKISTRRPVFVQVDISLYYLYFSPNNRES